MKCFARRAYYTGVGILCVGGFTQAWLAHNLLAVFWATVASFVSGSLFWSHHIIERLLRLVDGNEEFIDVQNAVIRMMRDILNNLREKIPELADMPPLPPWLDDESETTS